MSSDCCNSTSSCASNDDARNKLDTNALEVENVTCFAIQKMDCPAEEHLVRMALADVESIKALQFDLTERQVTIYHDGDYRDFSSKIDQLGLGGKLIDSRAFKAEEGELLKFRSNPEQEAKSLYWLLLINGVMFVFELVLGWYAQSTGLIADSLDMFADATVYGLALYAVGRSAQLQNRAAHLSGYMQMLLAVMVLIDVMRRFIYGSEPYSSLMMGVGAMALVANISCLMIIYRHREGGAHMKASWIFSANDVIANLGVIIAGVMVYFTGSFYPDLIIGMIISVIVLSGAFRILRLRSGA